MTRAVPLLSVRACARHQRRFLGGDLNPNVVRAAEKRLLAENRELLGYRSALPPACPKA